MAQFNLNDVTIVFFDQYRTLAVYDKTTGLFADHFKLRIKKEGISESHFFQIAVNGNLLDITETDTPPAHDDNGWKDYVFDLLNQAGDAWVQADHIIIGMGDIRGINATKDTYQLSDPAAPVHITSEGKHVLRIHKPI